MYSARTAYNYADIFQGAIAQRKQSEIDESTTSGVTLLGSLALDVLGDGRSLGAARRYQTRRRWIC